MTALRRGGTEQAADAAVDQACRALPLPTIRAGYDEIADAASREQLSYRGLFAELLITECEDHARRRSERRIREEKNSVAIASNESFSGWTRTFTDPRLCAAIVDRLTFGANIVETGTGSYRLAHARAQREAAAAASRPSPTPGLRPWWPAAGVDDDHEPGAAPPRLSP